MQIELDGATLIFVCGATLLLILYFVFSWKLRSRPELQHAVIICTAWGSFAPALYLGYQICVAKAADLGVLARLCTKCSDAKVRQGENSRGSGVYWL